MNAKKIVLTTLSAALIAGAAIPAFAAPGRDGPGRHDMGRGGPGRAMMQDAMFVRLLKNADTNKDASISREEVAAYQDRLFTEIDADKDGALTPGEFRAYRQAKMEEFRKNNPRPERAEREERREQRMAENNDGPGRDDRGPGERRWGMRHAGGPGFRLIRIADTDENGQLSKAEVTAAADRLFTRMDRNSDGAITIDDLPDRPL